MSEGPRFPDRRHVVEPDCSRCGALSEDRTHISWGTGPLDADVMVVGEAPAAGDPEADRWRGGNWTGKAYTSRHSGRRIRRLFADLGYGDRCYYTNAVKCFPRDRDAETITNREPTREERATCRAHLQTEIDRIDPTVICPTGRHATASVFALGDRDLDGFLESVLEATEMGIEVAEVGFESIGGRIDTTIIPLLHPAYQDVWRARLGYDDDEYRAAIAEALSAVL
ncbi:uracil-DNA glycosylase family protein [Halopenitus sp. H-Gu1]|uniref:uracil-DNA glycosylase n=1 Tax=Halopenitus sp. H-Gu1 TaxID=3242697 RepID=UPI00359EA78D